MRKLLPLIIALMLSGTAFAQVDAELAFDPTEVNAGDTVTLFAGIANLGDTDVVADLEMTLTFNDTPYGPFMGQLPLAAGEELSCEFGFMVPPLPYDFTLTIDLTVTAGEFTDTASATLTVHGATGGTAGEEVFQQLGTGMINAMVGEPTATRDITFGQLKQQYR